MVGLQNSGFNEVHKLQAVTVLELRLQFDGAMLQQRTGPHSCNAQTLAARLACSIICPQLVVEPQVSITTTLS